MLEASQMPSDPVVDLTTCDREPIHIPGQIQAHGCLLAVDHSTLRVAQASENLHLFAGVHAQDALGQTLSAILGEQPASAVVRALDPDVAEGLIVHAYAGPLAGRGLFDVVVHKNQGLLLVECEERPQTQDHGLDGYEAVAHAFARLQTASSLQRYCEMLAGITRELTGYDRVMIYRFGDDWSGEVFAESMNPERNLAPFLGLHYPASDIPAQARALFQRNNVRPLADAQSVHARILPTLHPATGASLDLSYAFLRGASTMYTEYLTNMGVRASLTLALTQGDALWGLVACHHYSPRRISHGHRLVCDLLARFASLQLTSRARSDELASRKATLELQRALVDSLAASRSFGEALSAARDQVQTFVPCGGVTIASGGGVYSAGQVPPAEHLERLVHLVVSNTGGNDILATSHLAEHYADAAELNHVAAGFLAVPLADGPGNVVIWWRPEIARTVHWAGDPNKPVEVGPHGDRLTPRKSFELWKEEVRGTSLPWTRLELEAATTLRNALVGVVAARSVELERLTNEVQRGVEELEAFAYIASHDLKEPLRGIHNHCSFLLEDAATRLAPDDRNRIDSVFKLITRMRALIDGLLDYSRLGRADHLGDEVDLATVIEECVADAALSIEQRKARVTIVEGFPSLKANESLLRQIVANLLSNAIKHNDSEPPTIEFGLSRAGDREYPARARGHRYAFYVRDNGIGIAPNLREAAFQIFRRVHPRRRFAEGTGVGLTIVRRAAQRLGGDAWIDENVVQGTKVWFVLGGST